METIKKYWTAATWDKRSMRDLQGWTVVVIGATDGVGYDCAKAFAEHNAHTIVVGRNKEKTAKYELNCSQPNLITLSSLLLLNSLPFHGSQS